MSNFQFGEKFNIEGIERKIEKNKGDKTLRA